MTTDTSLYRLTRDQTNTSRRSWFLVSQDAPEHHCAEIYPDSTSGSSRTKWGYTVLNHAVMPSKSGFATRASAVRGAIQAYERIAYAKNYQAHTIGDLVESNNYRSLTYDQDSSPAFATGSCPRCDAEMTPLLNVTDSSRHGGDLTRQVCVRCGNLVS